MEWYESFFENEYYIPFLEQRIERAKEQVNFLDFLLKSWEKKYGERYQKILDCACGIGRHSIPLAKLGYEVKGLDLSQKLLEYAKDWAKREGVEVEFKRGDMRKIPYPDNEFDVLLCMFNSFGYFPHEENVETLVEFRRVVRTNGLIMLDVPNRPVFLSSFATTYFDEAKDYVVLVRAKTEKARLKAEWSFYKRKGEDLKFLRKEKADTALYSREELEEMARKVGLKVVKFLAGFSAQELSLLDRRILAVFKV